MSDDASSLHAPVLLQRCCELLAPAIDGRDAPVVVDATLGLGGHSEALLSKFESLTVIGIDQDINAIDRAAARLSRFGERMLIEHARNDEIDAILGRRGITGINGALFDLGVSSMQLDFAERGFSYSADAPLDMRMNPAGSLTAEEILNSWSAEDIARILRDYGDERFARKIAAAVVRSRARRPLTTTSQLVELLYEAIPAPARRTGGHPAKRTFQALRIAVNDELGTLRRALPQALDATVVGGRVVVMSYQSGEDAIVKREFAHRVAVSAPRDLPLPAHALTADFSLVTRGAEKAGESEIAENPRAASVRLRAIERRAA